jgi:hypothetical protein
MAMPIKPAEPLPRRLRVQLAAYVLCQFEEVQRRYYMRRARWLGMGKLRKAIEGWKQWPAQRERWELAVQIGREAYRERIERERELAPTAWLRRDDDDLPAVMHPVTIGVLRNIEAARALASPAPESPALESPALESPALPDAE